jgi:hypothetical protein
MPLKICGLHEDELACVQDENCSIHKSCTKPCTDKCPLLQDEIEKPREIKVELNGVVKCYDVCMLHKSMELMGPRDPLTREYYSDQQREFISQRANTICQEPRVPVDIQTVVNAVVDMFELVAEETQTLEYLRFHMIQNDITKDKLEMAFMHHVVQVGPFRTHLSEDIEHFAITHDEIEIIFFIVSRLTRSTTLLYNYLTRTTFPICVERTQKRVEKNLRFTLGEFKKHRAIPPRLRRWVQEHQLPLLDYFCEMEDAYEMFIRPGNIEHCIALIADRILSITRQKDAVPGIRFVGSYTKDLIAYDTTAVRRALTRF